MNGVEPVAAMSPAEPAAATAWAGLHHGGKMAATRDGSRGAALTAAAANRPENIAKVVARIGAMLAAVFPNIVVVFAKIQSCLDSSRRISRSLSLTCAELWFPKS